MKNKHILILLLLLGIIFVTLGSYLKITHQFLFNLRGKNYLSIGLLFELTATVMILFKLLKNKKIKTFLNN